MLDLVGSKYGKLTVLEFAEKKKDVTFWFCECECGNQVRISRNNLRSGHAKSCGCLKNRKFNESKTWQGHGEISLRTWSHIKNQAADRDIPFEITIENAWEIFQEQNGICALTGWKISLLAPKTNYTAKTASLDRIDSKKGYLKDNVQWVHKDVNLMKSWFPNERFLDVCKAVSDHVEQRKN